MGRMNVVRRRVVAVVAMAALLVSGWAVAPSPASAAYPATGFEAAVYAPAGQSVWAGGTIYWQNRSVRIQGEVVDTLNDGSNVMVHFLFFHDPAGFSYASQTRSTSYGNPRGFDFTQQSLRGGFAVIDYRVCDEYECSPWYSSYRP